MPCFHPHRAWRTPSGAVELGREPRDGAPLALPCGGCVGCRQASARGWALRCQLELQIHDAASFTTLTYDDANKPPTLIKRHVQLFYKRLRKANSRSKTARPIRHFTSGEYGETTGRPHYHALLYGVHPDRKNEIEDAWGMGHARTYAINPGAISYVAGYTAKKTTDAKHAAHERLDPETGELYYWQPPFIQMSRRPGIGAHAKQWRNSWRLEAIQNGTRIPVPRYLHNAWLETATEYEIELLKDEKEKITLTRNITPQQLTAGEIIAIAQQARNKHKRKNFN